eukprot:scaffold64620_cov29-Tisochrysis_lutea.AAC.1
MGGSKRAVKEGRQTPSTSIVLHEDPHNREAGSLSKKEQKVRTCGPFRGSPPLSLWGRFVAGTSTTMGLLSILQFLVCLRTKMTVK